MTRRLWDDNLCCIGGGLASAGLPGTTAASRPSPNEARRLSMERHLLLTTAAVGGLAAILVVLPSVSAAQAPKMAGGYANAIAIPVDDPEVKAIAGALIKPEGAGPFPVIVYMG